MLGRHISRYSWSVPYFLFYFLFPRACDRDGYTQAQIKTLASIPVLVVFGDYLSEFDGFWQDAFDNCNAFIEQVNLADGNATVLWTPAVGIYGNSHMLMQDENNLELADPGLDRYERRHETISSAPDAPMKG